MQITEREPTLREENARDYGQMHADIKAEFDAEDQRQTKAINAREAGIEKVEEWLKDHKSLLSHAPGERGSEFSNLTDAHYVEVSTKFGKAIDDAKADLQHMVSDREQQRIGNAKVVDGWEPPKAEPEATARHEPKAHAVPETATPQAWLDAYKDSLRNAPHTPPGGELTQILDRHFNDADNTFKREFTQERSHDYGLER